MKRFGLIVNTRIKSAVEASYQVIDFLKNKIELVITKELQDSIKNKVDLDGVGIEALDDFSNQNLDILITIGGDGTILRTLHRCNIKIFGINAGVVGFLTEARTEEAKESLTRILADDYKLDKRVRLKTCLNDKELELATNEAVIHTAEIAKMRLYQIQVDGVLAQTIRADGIIISTPTGSTSYAMSAGGPILDPRVDSFLIVPIAPFKLSARPLVVPSTAKICLKLMEPDRNSILVIDGQVEYKITPSDILNFTRAETLAEFIRFELNFFKQIEEKLMV